MPWKLPKDETGLLALAKSYPYTAPAESYHFAQGEPRPFEEARFVDRVPVLAHGSNRSPAHLRRKFGTGADIPVTYGWLCDYDVVYSAHITQYGAVASTLHHVPGVRTRLTVNWLSVTQLERMHETEGPSNYAFGRLSGIELEKEAGPRRRCTEVFVYLGRNGCLDLDDGPIGLAATVAQGRSHYVHHQEEALDLVRTRHRPHLALDEMILGAVRNHEDRHALTREMRERAIAPHAPHFEELDV